jgi:predicted nucleotidyltransferase component of viral defense system
VVAERLGRVITRQELLDLAREFGLQPHIVEKDYALGWLLAGFGQHQDTRDTWLFKGGTCLKKCYFETYRFSEDLDFTLLDPAHLNEDFLRGLFQEVAEWVYEMTGLEMPAEARKIEVFDNGRGGRSGEGRMGYRGPIARGGDAPRIKLDLTDHERIVLPSVRRAIHHPYSDRPVDGMEVTTYAFEEVFAEKVRALAERLRPRDLYDVIHLNRRTDLEPDKQSLLHALREKCAFKGIAFPTLDSLRQSPLLAELRAAWDDMLAHQLPQLPPFESFWDELPAVFGWLTEDRRSEVLPSLALAVAGELDDTWRPPAMATSWYAYGARAPLEIVRFAAANRLCVELDYRDERGIRSSRIIEPYSLRRTSTGDLLLMAVKADTGEARSYRIDRIQGAVATNRTFRPRYAIELTSGTPTLAPRLARHSDAEWSRPRPALRPARPRGRSRTRPSRPASTGTHHTFRCTVCGKHFRKSTFDATLNSHKGKNGLPCYGTVGTFVKTTY